MSGAIHSIPQYAFMAWRSVKAQGQLYLTATAYSKYSQIPSIFGVRLLLPQTEDAACRGDRDPQNMALISGLCFSSHVGYRYIMRHIFKPV
jgi:hypothetical protein